MNMEEHPYEPLCRPQGQLEEGTDHDSGRYARGRRGGAAAETTVSPRGWLSPLPASLAAGAATWLSFHPSCSSPHCLPRSPSVPSSILDGGRDGPQAQVLPAAARPSGSPLCCVRFREKRGPCCVSPEAGLSRPPHAPPAAGPHLTQLWGGGAGPGEARHRGPGLPGAAGGSSAQAAGQLSRAGPRGHV